MPHIAKGTSCLVDDLANLTLKLSYDATTTSLWACLSHGSFHVRLILVHYCISRFVLLPGVVQLSTSKCWAKFSFSIR